MGLEKKLREFTYNNKAPVLPEIPFSSKLEQRIWEEIMSERKKKHRNFTQWTLTATTIVVVLVMVSLFSRGGFDQISTSMVHEEAFETLGIQDEQRLSQLDSLAKQGFTSKIDQSSSDQGITITVNEVYFDRDVLMYGYTIQIPEEKWALLLNSGIPNFTNVFYVNGKEMMGNYTGSTDIKKIGKDLYRGVHYMFVTNKLPDSFTFGLKASSIGARIRGDWVFQFPFSINESLKNQIVHRQYAESGYIGTIPVTIGDVRKTPVSATIQLKGKDLPENSNEIVVMDQQGQILGSMDASQQVNPLGELQQQKAFELRILTSSNTSSLQLFPWFYFENESPSKQVQIPLPKQPIEFTGKHGKVKISKIDVQASGIYLHYEVENPLDQLQNFIILDDSGLQQTRIGLPVRTSPDRYTYMVPFRAAPVNQKGELVYSHYPSPPLKMEEKDPLVIPMP